MEGFPREMRSRTMAVYENGGVVCKNHVGSATRQKAEVVTRNPITHSPLLLLSTYHRISHQPELLRSLGPLIESRDPRRRPEHLHQVPPEALDPVHRRSHLDQEQERLLVSPPERGRQLPVHHPPQQLQRIADAADIPHDAVVDGDALEQQYQQLPVEPAHAGAQRRTDVGVDQPCDDVDPQAEAAEERVAVLLAERSVVSDDEQVAWVADQAGVVV
ncbi:hypothetical protein IWX92DRAFT_402514 [Phyllosticta citricarpa]